MESRCPSKRGANAMAEAEAEDRLSALPDDLLHSILRQVPLKHAVRTSALSRRWPRLWLRALAASPVLDFSDHDFARGQRPARAAAMVRRCLRRHAKRGAPLDVFRVAFPSPAGAYGPDVVGWVAAALARGAREVVVDLTPTRWRRALDADWGVYSAIDDIDWSVYCSLDDVDWSAVILELPGDLFLAKNSLVRLTLVRCSLRAVPPGAAGLAGLRSLSLSHADVTDWPLRDVLATCSSLEFLSLRSCNLLFHAKVAGEKLRGLEIVGCLEMYELWIIAPALESFAFHGDIGYLDGMDCLTVNFGATPALRDAYLSHLGFGYFNEHRCFAYYNFLNCFARATILTICSIGLQHIDATRAAVPTIDVMELQWLIHSLRDQHIDATRPFALTMDVPNLQELQLLMSSLGDDDVDRIAGFFEITKPPFLDRLFIHLPASGKRARARGAAAALAAEEDEGIVSDVDLVLDHLTFIKVVNFRGTRCELRLLRFLVNSSPALEQMVLVTVEGEGTLGDEQMKIIQGQVIGMRAASPEARVTVCRAREDGSRNPEHTRYYHEE